jgi:hypothetical protein
MAVNLSPDSLNLRMVSSAGGVAWTGEAHNMPARYHRIRADLTVGCELIELINLKLSCGSENSAHESLP